MKGLIFDKMEKMVPNSMGVGGPIKALKKSTMKFSNGKEVDYKRIVALKKEGKCHFCEEKGHRANDCPKKHNKSNGFNKVEKEDF